VVATTREGGFEGLAVGIRRHAPTVADRPATGRPLASCRCERAHRGSGQGDSPGSIGPTPTRAEPGTPLDSERLVFFSDP
jgi:hypothetical protein